VCWENCRPGYHDDGATCRKDAHIIGANNSKCPWYDKCGLTFAKHCSTCPDSSYHNDGCTCRQDVHIYGKSSYGRGVGTIPKSAGPSQWCKDDESVDDIYMHPERDPLYDAVQNPNDDTWSMFARLAGDQGYCSTRVLLDR
jgi:hypothetical protein